MSAIGYASLPITVSLRGLQETLMGQLEKPAVEASKRAGEAIQKNLVDGAKKAADEVDKATKASNDAAKELEKAQESLKGAKANVIKITKQQQAAELDLERVTVDAKARAAKAQREYDALVKSGTASAKELADAETAASNAALKAKSDILKAESRVQQYKSQNVNAAQKEEKAALALAEAQQKATKATDDLEAATARLNRAQSTVEISAGNAESVFSRIGDASKNAVSQLGQFAQAYQMHATVVVGAMGMMAKGAMEYAAEAEQSYGAVESVFKDHSDKIIAQSKTAAEAVGLSGREYRELSAVTGAMLKNLGLPMEETTATTQKLVAVGADLAATFGGPTSEAMEAIGSLLRGEADPIERYGVSIKEADISARLAAEGLGKLEGEAGKQAKAQAILSLLMEQTADAQGQFSRELDTAAGKQAVANAKMQDAKEVIGTALLPIYAELASVGAKVAEAIGQHPKIFLALAGAIGALAGSTIIIGQISMAFSGIAAAASAAGMGIKAFLISVATTVGTLTAWVAAVAAVGVALWAFFTKTETGRQLWDQMVNALRAGWDWISGVFSAGWDYLSEKVYQFGQAVSGVWDILSRGDFTGGIFGISEDHPFINFLFRTREGLTAFRDLLSGVADAMQNRLVAAWQSVQPFFQSFGEFLAGSLGAAFNSLWQALVSIGDALATAGTAIGTALMPMLHGLWNLLVGLWNFISPVLMPVLQFLGALLGGVIVGAIAAVSLAFQGLSAVIQIIAEALNWLVTTVFAPLVTTLGTVAGFVMNVLGAAFSGLWSVIQTVGNGILTVLQFVFVAAVVPLLTIVKLAWDGLSFGIQWAWENLIRPAWFAMQAAISVLWSSFLQPTFELIKSGFAIVGNIIQAVWEGSIKIAWEAISVAANWLWYTILEPIFNLIKAGFEAVGNGIKWVWDNVIKPVWDIIYSTANWLWYNALGPVFELIKAGFDAVGNVFSSVWNNVIKPAWEAMGNGISWVVENVLKPAFSAIETALNATKTAFSIAVEAIGKTWDDIKAKTAKPINFVIDTVYNNGIRKVWEKVSDFVGLDKKLPHVPTVAAKTGAVLPGYTPGKDVHEFLSPTGGRLLLSGGEAVMRPEWVRAVGGKPAIDAMNQAARTGGIQGARRQIDELNARYATGGIIGVPTSAYAYGGVWPGVPVTGPVVTSIVGLINRFFPGMQITSTHRPGHSGYHGMNKAVDASNGFDTTPQMQALARFFHKNYGSGIAQLIHWPLNGWQNILNGAPFNYGEPTNSEHRNHVHIASNAALPAPGEEFAPIIVDGGGGGGGSFIRTMLAEAVSSILDPIGEKIPSFGGMIGEFPRAAFNWLKEKVIGKIEGEAGAYSGPGGSSGNAESWRSMIIAAYKRQGYEPVPAEIDAWVRQIETESSGNPNAVQQIVDINGTGESAGVGLLQIIPSTWAANRDPDLPDDRKDPWANINGAIRYGKRRYGSNLLNVIGHGHGYKDGGILPAQLYDSGGILQPNSLAVNLSGKPEAVLTAEQWETLRQVSQELKNAFIGKGGGFKATGMLIGDQELADRIGAMTTAIGDFLGTSAKSIKAMEDLKAAQESYTDQSETVKAAEKELEEARKEAKEAAESSTEASKAATRKVADAEEALAEARSSGKTEKIADAEKKLARAREDLADSQAKNTEKSADSQKNANEKVEKAEKKLKEAREKHADSLAKIQKAEDAVMAARLETAYDLFKAAGDVIVAAFNGVSTLGEAVAKNLQVIDETRQAVSSYALQVANARIAMVSASLDLQTAEFDLQRTRVNGLISIAEAQANLEAAQRESVAGTYDAFGFAINRYREAGLDAWGQITDGAVERTAKVRAAEAALHAAQAQALLDQHVAQEKVRAASFAAAQASLTQQKAVLLLALSTEKLQAEAARLYGLEGSQATAAQRGLSGLAKGAGGAFGILGGIATAVISGMTGNIPGAVAGAIAAVKGIGDAWTGFREYKNNRTEAKQVLDGLSTGDKIGLFLGGAGAAAAIGGGAYLATNGYGADAAVGGMQIGAEIINSTFGTIATNLQSDMDRIALESKIRTEALERDYEARKALLDMQQAASEAQGAIKTSELTTLVELAKINQQIAESSNAEIVKRLKELADIQMANRDASVQLHESTIKDLADSIAEANRLANEASKNSANKGNRNVVVIDVPIEKQAYSAAEVEAILNAINSTQEEMEIRLREIEEEKKATAWDYASTVRG